MKKLLTFGFVILLAFCVVSIWTDRNLDFWLSHFKGEQVDCPMWMSVVATIILNGIILAVNIIGEIARYFL